MTVSDSGLIGALSLDICIYHWALGICSVYKTPGSWELGSFLQVEDLSRFYKICRTSFVPHQPFGSPSGQEQGTAHLPFPPISGRNEAETFRENKASLACMGP